MDFAKRRRFERNKTKPSTHLGRLMCWSFPVHIPLRQRFAQFFFCFCFSLFKNGRKVDVAKQWSRFNKRCVRTQMDENHVCQEGCVWYPFPRRKLKQDGGAELFARSVQRVRSDPWDKVYEVVASLVPHALPDAHDHDNHIHQEYSCSVTIHD